MVVPMPTMATMPTMIVIVTVIVIMSGRGRMIVVVVILCGGMGHDGFLSLIP